MSTGRHGCSSISSRDLPWLSRLDITQAADLLSQCGSALAVGRLGLVISNVSIQRNIVTTTEGRTVTTVTRDVGFSVGRGRWSAGWRWASPISIEFTDDDGTAQRLSIRDHVVEARLAVLIGIGLVLLGRSLRT